MAARAAIEKRQKFIEELFELEQEIINFNIELKKENKIVNRHCKTSLLMLILFRIPRD